MQVNSSYTFQSPYSQPVQTGTPDASMLQAQEAQKNEQSKKSQEMTDEQRKNAATLVEANSKAKQREIYVKSSAMYQNDQSASNTSLSVKQYMEFSQDVKRSNALNTYVNNSGDFSGATSRPQPL
jgi:hypothetical protein